MFSREEPRRDNGRSEQHVIPGTAPKRLPNDAQEPVVMNIGLSIRIKGLVTGSEDLTVDGHVEGQVELPDHAFVVGSHASVKADIAARSVVIFGSVLGRVTAREKVEIRSGGSLQGDIIATRLAIHDGANFVGTVDMPKPQKADGKSEKVAYLVAV
jgi:cytoskeletal protein CcmA (bactofilin family)